MVALLSTEAEYWAMLFTTKEIAHARSLLADFGTFSLVLLSTVVTKCREDC